MKHTAMKLMGILICFCTVMFCGEAQNVKYTSSITAVFAEDDHLQVEVGPRDQDDDSADAFSVEIIRNQLQTEFKDIQVLIYHTHTYEAYEQEQETPYKQLERWRTADDRHNVIAVGKALAAQLTAMGIQVTHDTTAFEPPRLDDAYSRSLEMLEARQSRGEQYDLYIDLHRDALASASTIERTVTIGGEEVARFMVLVGQGTTGGYADKPDFEANHAVATMITDALKRQCEALARDVKVKTGRFNQHIADHCVLIECGTNWNTLSEVLAGIPYLAQAIHESLTFDEK